MYLQQYIPLVVVSLATAISAGTLVQALWKRRILAGRRLGAHMWVERDKTATAYWCWVAFYACFLGACLYILFTRAL